MPKQSYLYIARFIFYMLNFRSEEAMCRLRDSLAIGLSLYSAARFPVPPTGLADSSPYLHIFPASPCSKPTCSPRLLPCGRRCFDVEKQYTFLPSLNTKKVRELFFLNTRLAGAATAECHRLSGLNDRSWFSQCWRD